MRFLGNLFWFLFAGLWLCLAWTLAGLFWCITIVGIPWALQCFKFAKLMAAPFGKEVVLGNSMFSLLLNMIWIIVSGVPLAIFSAILGVILCVTIIGIPLGRQCFKFAQLAFLPFGAKIVRR